MKVDQFIWTTRKSIHLICRKQFTAAGGVEIKDVDYNGFTVRDIEGITHTFLLLLAGDADYDAVDVTTEMARGYFFSSERSKPAA